MRTEVIRADSIDAAAERILGQLKEEDTSTRRRENVIYFDGWDGLGATAVLGAVARRLAGVQFDQILHIDCSKWESRRALQRVIAEQLELPAEVMDMFNRQDEEDDFNGVAQGSRDEVLQVREAMYERIQKLNHRFLVIFHNGSGEEIDLASFCGFPLSGYSRNTVLWTFQGRFRLNPRTKVDTALRSTGMTDVVLSATCHEKDPRELWSYLVHQEAVDLIAAACKNNTHHDHGPGGIINQPAQVAECFLYLWKLCGMVHQLRMDYDLATHCCNYWICDGIIPLRQLGQVSSVSGDDGTWRPAHALQQEMQLDEDYHSASLHQFLPSHLKWCAESVASMTHWTSPTFLCSYTDTVLFFPSGDTFQHFSKLGVLKLSRCTFSFSSPAFHRCHNLRFLWLDRCQDEETSSADGIETGEDSHRCFQRLWVLDVRYTCCDQILSAHMMDLMTQLRVLNVMGAQDWDMGQMQGRLHNIRKLRVTKSTIHCSTSSSENDLFSGMKKMELLDFSGNRVTGGMKSLSVAASSSSSLLETIIIDDGSVGLQHISFSGCAKLKNVLLRGLFEELESLDISGSAVKALDLSAMTAQKLDEIVLLDSNKLCAILWPPEDKRKEFVQKLRIDTTEGGSSTSATAAGSSSLVKKHGGRAPAEFYWYLSLRDARFLRSIIVPFKKYISDYRFVHVEISTPKCRSAMYVGGTTVERINSGIGTEQQVPANLPKTEQQPEAGNALMYADASASLKDHVQQASKGLDDGDAPSIAQIWPCPSAPQLHPENCYMYIQDQPMKTTLSSGEVTSTAATIMIPDFICDRAWTLHVHDSLSITRIPADAQWRCLIWCRVERCPKLDYLFTTPTSLAGKEMFYYLNTLWASQLLKARFIWNWNRPSIFSYYSCWNLRFLHVDFCPRLIHVLPFSEAMIKNHSRHLLETLEIVWCGDLRAVFPLETDAESHQADDQQQQQAVTVKFPYLKQIHLHELPKLHGICGSGRMYAPKLESIKIRGCWSLTRLPVVGGGDYKEKVECDCEKEWWDRLKWDDNHHGSLYKPTHPRYSKKTLLRGYVLH